MKTGNSRGILEIFGMLSLNGPCSDGQSRGKCTIIQIVNVLYPDRDSRIFCRLLRFCNPTGYCTVLKKKEKKKSKSSTFSYALFNLFFLCFSCSSTQMQV